MLAVVAWFCGVTFFIVNNLLKLHEKSWNWIIDESQFVDISGTEYFKKLLVNLPQYLKDSVMSVLRVHSKHIPSRNWEKGCQFIRIQIKWSYTHATRHIVRNKSYFQQQKELSIITPNWGSFKSFMQRSENFPSQFNFNVKHIIIFWIFQLGSNFWVHKLDTEVRCAMKSQGGKYYSKLGMLEEALKTINIGHVIATFILMAIFSGLRSFVLVETI